MRQTTPLERSHLIPLTLSQELLGVTRTPLFPDYIVIADRYGKLVGTKPERKFEGLDHLINTGKQDESEGG